MPEAEQAIEMLWKVKSTGAVLEDGRLRAVFAVPVLSDEHTATAMGVPVGTANDDEGSKLLLQHVSHELQELLVAHREITMVLKIGEVKAPPAPPPTPVLKAKKARKKS